VTQSTIQEPARQTPVLMEADIVIVGGGTTGPVAAIAAARRGRKVVLIERFGSLGGILTLGLNTKPSGSLIGGIPLEIWNLARSAGAPARTTWPPPRPAACASPRRPIPRS
jgi:NADPH-dependent 2,4-dienoyl-CoA reductase/sulfur reductase-like enzyme